MAGGSGKIDDGANERLKGNGLGQIRMNTKAASILPVPFPFIGRHHDDNGWLTRLAKLFKH